MTKCFFAFLFISLCWATSYSQTAESPFDLGSLDEQLLEKLILQKINAHRTTKNLETLYEDQILAKAAQNQSDFQAKIKRLNHFQPNKIMANPARRVFFYEGNHSTVGENCAFVPVLETSTYETVAEQFYQGWLHSPPHYKNMITPDYRLSGIRFKADTIDGGKIRIFGTHVFGGVTALPIEGVDMPKDAYGILPRKKAFCTKQLGRYDFIAERMASYIFFRGDTIFFGYSNTEEFKKIISHSTDGLAVDIVARQQFPCDDPNRINGVAPYRGVMLPPVFRNDLLKNNRTKSQNRLITPIAVVPPGLKGNYQFNIITIKKKCACKNSHYLSIPHNDLPLLDIYPIWHTADTNNIIPLPSKEIVQRVQFHQGQDTLRDREWRQIIKHVRANKKNIQRVHIFATSSIEGSSRLNLKLQKDRAKYIKKRLAELGVSSKKVSYNTLERWDMFYDQIMTTPYGYLKDLSKDEIRKAISKDRRMASKLEPLLAEQRQTLITFKVSTSDEYVNIKVNERALLKKFEQEIKAEQLDSALRTQTQLIKGFVHDKCSRETMLKTELPLEEKYLPFLSNQMAVELFFGDYIPKSVYIPNWGDPFLKVDEDFVHKLKTLVDMDRDYLPMQFNLHGFAIKFMRYTRMTLIEPDTLLQAVQTFNDSSRYGKFALNNDYVIEKLKLNYHLAAADYFFDMQEYQKRNESLLYVKEYFERQDMQEGETVILAKYFNRNYRFGWAIDLLEPFVLNKSKNEEAIYTFLQTQTLLKGDKVISKFPEIWDRALSLNKKRFCRWGNANFQLLYGEDFKPFYCTNCE
ncbi:MAG: hypothetical protein GY810_20265 [Aureispira sp.]|nr:hypothetical protein [Aureispira sp.]